MFYTTFEELCRERNVAPSAVARRLGMSSSAPGRWKTGSSPDLDTAQKIADFFGVTIDFLVNNDRPGGIVTTGSSVVVGGERHTSTGGTVNYGSTGETLSEMEKELLRIFRKMDMRKKNIAMSYFYDLEDQMKEV